MIRDFLLVRGRQKTYKTGTYFFSAKFTGGNEGVTNKWGK